MLYFTSKTFYVNALTYIYAKAHIVFICQNKSLRQSEAKFECEKPLSLLRVIVKKQIAFRVRFVIACCFVRASKHVEW